MVLHRRERDRLWNEGKHLSHSDCSASNKENFTMADRIDSMSDAELCTKLAEHGFSIMPITSTSRKLLIDMLKSMLNNKSEQPNSVETNIENTQSPASAKKRRGNQMTTSGATLPPVTKIRRTLTKDYSPVKRHDKDSEFVKEKSPVRAHEEVETVTTRRVTHFAMADQVDSMSDAELRMKLVEHGFPITPIAASSRTLLIEMFKLVSENKSKPCNSVESKIENTPSLVNATRKRGNQATSGGTMLPSVTKNRFKLSQKDSTVKSDDKVSEGINVKSPVRTHEEVETVTTRRVTHFAIADQVDSMTDAELRTKLTEHGFPIMPITASSRKLLVKKLKLLLENKSNPCNRIESKIKNTQSPRIVKRNRRNRAIIDSTMPHEAEIRFTPSKEDSTVKRNDKGPKPVQKKSPLPTHEEVETVTTRRVTRTFDINKPFEKLSD